MRVTPFQLRDEQTVDKAPSAYATFGPAHVERQAQEAELFPLPSAPPPRVPIGKRHVVDEVELLRGDARLF